MVALISLSKNEKPYIQEWINYYLAMGVSTIYLYDDRSDNELSYLQNSTIKIIQWGNDQVAANNHWLSNYRHLHDWILYFDVDEFLVLHTHDNIADFCEQYIASGALGVNWYFFGNNGKEKYEDKPVLERFTRRQKNINQHVKTIAKCTDIASMLIHNPIKLTKGQFIDTNGNSINGPFNPIGSSDVCQLNHYFCKSTEELERKCKRGGPAAGVFRNFETHKRYLNFNDVEDLAALSFYKRKTRQNPRIQLL